MGSDDGDITNYSWRSSLDGQLFDGSWEEARSRPLTKGHHTIYLKVQDDHGVWSEEVSVSLEVVEQRGDESDDELAKSRLLIALTFLTILVGLMVVIMRLPRSYFEK